MADGNANRGAGKGDFDEGAPRDASRERQEGCSDRKSGPPGGPASGSTEGLPTAITKDQNKKASLEEQIAEMKMTKLMLQKRRQDLSKVMKVAQRKRRRLKKRAALLSHADLFEVCRMKNMDPGSMEEAQSESHVGDAAE